MRWLWLLGLVTIASCISANSTTGVTFFEVPSCNNMRDAKAWRLSIPLNPTNDTKLAVFCMPGAADPHNFCTKFNGTKVALPLNGQLSRVLRRKYESTAHELEAANNQSTYLKGFLIADPDDDPYMYVVLLGKAENEAELLMLRDPFEPLCNAIQAAALLLGVPPEMMASVISPVQLETAEEVQQLVAQPAEWQKVQSYLRLLLHIDIYQFLCIAILVNVLLLLIIFLCCCGFTTCIKSCTERRQPAYVVDYGYSKNSKSYQSF